MKKLISITLATLMFLSSFTITAFASDNGPEDYSEIFEYFASSIIIVETDGNGQETAYTTIYDSDGIHNIDGVAYDRDSNTLTLTSYNSPDNILRFSNMGDDFTLKIEGICSLATIQANSYYWSNSVNFSGNGELTVNKNKVFDYGITQNCNSSESAVRFGKCVNVTISGKIGAVVSNENARTDINNVFTFDGTTNAEVLQEDFYGESSNYYDGYSVDMSPVKENVGTIGERASDPDGVYITGTASQEIDGEKEEGYWAQKYVYSQALKVWLADGNNFYSFEPKYEWDTTSIGSDFDVESTGELLYNETKSSKLVNIGCSLYTADNGTVYAYDGYYWDQSISEMYHTVFEIEPIPDLTGKYEIKNVLYTHEEADNFIEGLTELEEKADVYFISDLKPEQNYLGYKVKSEEDPDGLYYMKNVIKYKYDENDEITEVPCYWVNRYVKLNGYENTYVEDDSFGNWGNVEIAPQDIETSGYTYLYNDKDEKIEGYSIGKVTKHHGIEYISQNEESYAVTEILDDNDQIKKQAYNIGERIEGLGTDDEPYYLFTPANDVDTESLTEAVTKTLIDGIMNHYIINETLTYCGYDSTDFSPTTIDIRIGSKEFYNITGDQTIIVDSLDLSDITVLMQNGMDVEGASDEWSMSTKYLDSEGRGVLEVQIFSETSDSATFNLVSHYGDCPGADFDDFQIMLITAHKHQYTSNVTKAPTCAETGVTTFTCAGCGDTKTEDIPKTTVHTPVVIPAVPATTESTGLTEGSKCAVCGAILVAQTVVDKLPAPTPEPTPAVTKVSVPKITLNSVKSKKSKQITVSWKKNTKVTGYEVQYSTDKKFKKSVKTATIKKNKTTSTTITKLKGKKKYYVRIRAYKTVKGKKYYSSWSKAITVTTKK